MNFFKTGEMFPTGIKLSDLFIEKFKENPEINVPDDVRILFKNKKSDITEVTPGTKKFILASCETAPWLINHINNKRVKNDSTITAQPVAAQARRLSSNI